ncbi:MAG TPA: PfkB family carbohydrate kinase, partial [Cyclobacteriaceae bacterium]|nr:PfkB family carbohydrate kinase [Cyclobacteriaceae bacterium]
DKSIGVGNSKEEYLEQALKTSESILSKFPKVQTVANTFRFDYNETGIRYYTSLYNNNKLFVSDEYVADKIVDKVGSGDCFMAGIIRGLYMEQPEQELLNFATAAAYQKLFIESDATTKTVSQIEQDKIAYAKK